MLLRIVIDCRKNMSDRVLALVVLDTAWVMKGKYRV